MTMTAPKKKAKPGLLKLDAVTADELITETVPPVGEADPVVQKKSPKPGDPNYDWAEDYPGEDVFTFTASDGRTVGLAAMGATRRPKPGVLRKLRHQPPIEQMWFVIERVSSEAALEVSDDFEDEDYSEMFEQWSEWSNTTAGESSRSSAS